GVGGVVFLRPWLALREQVAGNMDGGESARLPEAEVVGLMQRAAVVAAAGGRATAFVHQLETRRQHGASGNHLLEAALQHPSDRGGVARDTHRWTPRTPGKFMVYRKRPEKP